MGPQGGGGASLAVPLTRPKDVGILHFAPGLVQCLEGGGSQNIFIQWMDGVDWEKAQGQGWGMKSWRWKAASHRFGQIWALWTGFLCSLLHGPTWLERPLELILPGFLMAKCCSLHILHHAFPKAPTGSQPKWSDPSGFSPSPVPCISSLCVWPSCFLFDVLTHWLAAGLRKRLPPPPLPASPSSEEPKYTHYPPFILPYKSAFSGYTERKLFWVSGFNSWLLKDLTWTWFHILARWHWFPICSPKMLAAQPIRLVWPAFKTQERTMVN